MDLAHKKARNLTKNLKIGKIVEGLLLDVE